MDMSRSVGKNLLYQFLLEQNVVRCEQICSPLVFFGDFLETNFLCFSNGYLRKRTFGSTVACRQRIFENINNLKAIFYLLSIL